MRSFAFLTLIAAVAFAAGCKKKPKETQPDTAPPPHVSSVNSPTAPNQNGNLSVSGGGSGFGAVQAVRKAAARTVNDAQMRDLHLSLSQSFLIDNRLPSAKEIVEEAKRNPQLLPLLQEEVIILTGATRGDQVWAYTQYPQRAGEHYVITSSGVDQMAPEVLKARLEQEKAPVKLSK
jgi:hypothetical protein